MYPTTCKFYQFFVNVLFIHIYIWLDVAAQTFTSWELFHHNIAIISFPVPFKVHFQLEPFIYVKLKRSKGDVFIAKWEFKNVVLHKRF